MSVEMNAKPYCENCRFSGGIYCGGKLNRKRYPRVAALDPYGHTEFVYPEHDKDDWCGEWQNGQAR